VITLGQARTLAVVLVLAVVALGLIAIRSARRASELHGRTPAVVAAESGTPGASAHLRHTYRVSLGHQPPAAR
jgi:hypothetical protein